MTASQIQLVQSSFSELKPIGDFAAVLFYERLFEVAPHVRTLFRNSDTHQQGKKFMTMMGMVVGSLERLEPLLETVAEMGRRHAGYGVLDEHYEAFRDALLWMLAKALGEEFTPEVEEAWREAYNLLAKIMKNGVYSAPAVA